MKRLPLLFAGLLVLAIAGPSLATSAPTTPEMSTAAEAGTLGTAPGGPAEVLREAFPGLVDPTDPLAAKSCVRRGADCTFAPCCPDAGYCRQNKDGEATCK